MRFLLAFGLILLTHGRAPIAQAIDEKKRDMKPEIERLIAKSGATSVSFACYDLATKRQVFILPDVSYHPASTFKLCVMMEWFHQAQQGALRLDDPVTVKNEFKSIVDSSPFTLSAADDSETDLYKQLGMSLPARDLIQRMITRSSNLATNILIERVTPARVTRFMRELGGKDLLVRRGVEDNKAYALGLNNAATARSLMRVLVRLAERKVVSPEASDEMIAILKQQHYREGIPALLPAEVEIAHKTGWNEKLYHDAAIVTPARRKPYVLVVLTKGLPEDKEAPALVAQISRLIYDNLEKE